MFTKILSIFLLVFLFIGCSNPIQQTVPKKNESFPQWILNPSPSNALFYYASADGINTAEAKNNALKQISSEISITISSNTTSTKLATTTTYEKSIKDITNAVTKEINFTGVTVIEQAFKNGLFYSYVRVNREILFENQFKQMNMTYNTILSLEEKINSNNIFYVFKESQNLTEKIDTILEQLAILKSIKNSFDDVPYLLKIATIQEKNKNHLIIITLDKSVKPYENRYKSQKMQDVSFADVILKVVTYDNTRKIKLAQNTINVRNASREGYEAAVIKTLKLEREIKQKGILNALLETL